MSEKIDEQINKVSQILDIQNQENAIIEIVPTPNKNEKKLVLKSGSWDAKEPWFCIDKDENLQLMMSMQSFVELFQAYEKTARENFNLQLEKNILKHLPIDYDDVLAVCIDELQNTIDTNKNEKNLDIDFNVLVKNIKKRYPNLFMNLDNFAKQVKMKGKI